MKSVFRKDAKINNGMANFFKIHLNDDNATKSLLEIEQNKFDLYLQRLYVSKPCQIFYLLLLSLCVVLVLWTIMDKSIVDGNPIFIILEVVINIIIVTDFIFRLRIGV
jgi:hypothetical protein